MAAGQSVLDGSDGNEPEGEPAALPMNGGVSEPAGSSGSIDEAMTSVTTSLQRISPAGDVIAEGQTEDAETFRRAVDEVLTSELPAS